MSLDARGAIASDHFDVNESPSGSRDGDASNSIFLKHLGTSGIGVRCVSSGGGGGARTRGGGGAANPGGEKTTTGGGDGGGGAAAGAGGAVGGLGGDATPGVKSSSSPLSVTSSRTATVASGIGARLQSTTRLAVLLLFCPTHDPIALTESVYVPGPSGRREICVFVLIARPRL